MQPDKYPLFIPTLKGLKLPEPVREYRFCERRWKIDYAWPNYKLAVEVEGGAFSRPVICPTCKKPVRKKLKNGGSYQICEGGRHNSSGFIKDMEKYNNLVLNGFQLFRFTPKQINDGDAAVMIEKWFKEYTL